MRDTRARIPVVMCTWRRPEYFPRTLRALEAQHDVAVELHIWNNNPRIAAQLERAAAASALEVRFHHSAENIGGFGRFHLARELAPDHPHVVFLDDDQLFGSRTLATLRQEARSGTISGWWAYRFPFPPHYWLRVPVRRGHRAHYVGTCGMIADASIFRDDRLFACPDRFRFVEDVWLSYVAAHLHGWTLLRSRATFFFIPDTRNQVTGLIGDKTEFLRYLTARGWLRGHG